MTLVDCGEMFRPSNDLEIINTGTEHTIRVAEARKAQLEAVRSDLRALSRNLEASKTAAQRPAEVPSKQQHTKALEKLEHAQHETNRAILKYQSELDAAVARVGRVKDEKALWESKDPEGEHEVDAIAIRAQIWKSMGFELRRGREPAQDKVLIRTESGDLRLVPLPSNRKPSVEETNELWKINLS
ncbi:hypothetical protein M408DRAFT_327834, partial [Serendipita vermifera MAFF 305830]